jgi:hypothetical protein
LTAAAVGSAIRQALDRARIDTLQREVALAQERLRAAASARELTRRIVGSAQDALRRDAPSEAVIHLLEAQRHSDPGAAQAVEIPETGADLATTMRALAKNWQARQGMDVRVRISGHRATLLPEQEATLVHTVHTCLGRLAQPARANCCVIDCTMRPDSTEVEIRINGVGLSQLERQQPAVHTILRALQMRLESATGRFEVHEVDYGLAIRAVVLAPARPEALLTK